MNIKEIKELLDLMQEHHIASLEYEKGDVRLKLNKYTAPLVQAEAPRMVATPVSFPVPTGTQKEAAESINDPHLITIRSPMVGTYYSSPAPDQPPYIKVGQPVKVGDVVCIIEAMKLMNEIKAEVAGIVVEIPLENGQPIEYDQPILKIKKG